MSPHQKAVDLTIDLSDLYICAGCPTQAQGKACSAEGEPGFLGAHAPPQRWWEAGTEAGNSFCYGLNRTKEFKNAVLGSLGSISRRKKTQGEGGGGGSGPLSQPSASSPVSWRCCCRFPALPPLGPASPLATGRARAPRLTHSHDGEPGRCGQQVA